MAVFRYTREAIVPLTQTTFAHLGIGERDDLTCLSSSLGVRSPLGWL